MLIKSAFCKVTVSYFSVLYLLVLFSQTSVHAKTEYVSIGTGGVSGVYYPTGGAICHLLNKVDGVDPFSCQIKSTPGSIYNLKAIKAVKLI